ncbi:MAG: hypothetical protein QM530_06145 [Phycisphaerales bacterium]|nr:hypothetical protein [Phycisphaerales bacterium]
MKNWQPIGKQQKKENHKLSGQSILVANTIGTLKILEYSQKNIATEEGNWD